MDVNVDHGTWYMVHVPITSQHFEFSYGHERGAWSELTTLTSQYFQIRYGGYRG